MGWMRDGLGLVFFLFFFEGRGVDDDDDRIQMTGDRKGTLMNVRL